LTTEWGKPFTVDGFSGWMRNAMTEAGLPLDFRPHGLGKTFGRLLADAGTTAHDIMAAVGHLTLAEVERCTCEADRRRGGRRAILKLEDHKATDFPKPLLTVWGNRQKWKRNQSEKSSWRSLGESNPCFSLERAAS
jgi:enterobacteria phage integrase